MDTNIIQYSKKYIFVFIVVICFFIFFIISSNKNTIIHPTIETFTNKNKNKNKNNHFNKCNDNDNENTNAHMNIIEPFIRDTTHIPSNEQIDNDAPNITNTVSDLSINNDYGESLNTNFATDNPLNIHIPRQLFYRGVKKKHNVAFKLKMNYIQHFINDVFASLISEICTVEAMAIENNDTKKLLNNSKNNGVDLTMIEEDIFDSLDKHNLFFVSALYYKSFTFVVKETKSITNISDLEEKTIFGVLKHSYDAIRIIYITKILNMRLGGIIFYSDFASMAKDFINDKFDVMFVTVSHPDKKLLELSKKTKFVFLNFNYELKPQLYQHSKIPFKHQIKSKQYGFLTLDGNIYTFAIREIIVANGQANKWSIYSFLNLMINNINYIDDQTNYLYTEQLTIENMCFLQKKLIYHQGAFKYWTDKGLIIRKLAHQPSAII
jgi:TRAP-type uncharacterized transport system substrate-binding protein